MPYRRIGITGLKVSTICLGTMQFGWSADEPTAHRIMDEAVDMGLNFLDTADVYSRWVEGNPGGVSEEIIGRWLKARGKRHEVVVATKVRGQMGSDPNARGLSRGHIFDAVEASLKRLQTDYLDLYQLHAPDEDTPLEETLRALDDLVRSGKVRYIGCSNYPAWQLMKALWLSDVGRLARLDVLQPHYSLVHRAEFERALQAVCLDQKIGVIPYSPLGGGFLTGKYRRGQALPASARANRVQERYLTNRGFAILDAVDAVAAELEATPAQVAIAWVLANPTVSAAIIGANTVGQLEETAKGGRLTLSPDQKQRLDDASRWNGPDNG